MSYLTEQQRKDEWLRYAVSKAFDQGMTDAKLGISECPFIATHLIEAWWKGHQVELDCIERETAAEVVDNYGY